MFKKNLENAMSASLSSYASLSFLNPTSMVTNVHSQHATPHDYHRIITPSLVVPSDPLITIPVGLLACQRDPLLRTLHTTVVGVSLSSPAPVSTTGKPKTAVLASTHPDDPILEVILHDTIVFPEGGGQPSDTGVIITGDASLGHKTWEVLQAKRHGGHAVHYVRVHNASIKQALQAFAPGQQVTVELDGPGYERRYDHMSMHTSEHLLAALLEARLNLKTLSWSLPSYPAPCYVDVPRAMNNEEILTIQNEANKLVFEGRRVHVEVSELDERQIHTETDPILGSRRLTDNKIPQDYTGGVKRVVVIDGVDRNACCGTHLPTIHNLQLFLLPHTEALARSSTIKTRLYFLAGPRLIAHLMSTHTLLKDTASVLTCGLALVPERVTQAVEERKLAEKRIGEVEAELAQMIASSLTADILVEGGTGLYKKYIPRSCRDSGNVLRFLTSIAVSVSEQIANKNIQKPFLFVFTSCPATQSADSVTSVVVAGTDEKVVKIIGDTLQVKLGLKGGGKGVRWSGKYHGVWKEKDDTIVQEVLETL